MGYLRLDDGDNICIIAESVSVYVTVNFPCSKHLSKPFTHRFSVQEHCFTVFLLEPQSGALSRLAYRDFHPDPIPVHLKVERSKVFYGYLKQTKAEQGRSM